MLPHYEILFLHLVKVIDIYMNCYFTNTIQNYSAIQLVNQKKARARFLEYYCLVDCTLIIFCHYKKRIRT
jgi:hypothetical protein